MAHLAGVHTFTIDGTGLACYPQLEALPITAPEHGSGRAGFGLPRLDQMLGGGLNEGTTTMLAGGPGTGKTVLALHFLLAGAEREEPGLLVGFQESRAQLEAKAAGLGLDLGAALETGLLQVIARAPVALDVDLVSQELLERIDRSGVRRLVVDSARELHAAIRPARGPDFLAALVAQLRSKRVTTILTRETPKIAAAELDFAESALAILAENVLLLQQVEHRAELRRLVSVLKMRFSDHDRELHEFWIAERGMMVGGRFVADDASWEVAGSGVVDRA
jgi:circadian clock protein KaiC